MSQFKCETITINVHEDNLKKIIDGLTEAYNSIPEEHRDTAETDMYVEVDYVSWWRPETKEERKERIANQSKQTQNTIKRKVRELKDLGVDEEEVTRLLKEL